MGARRQRAARRPPQHDAGRQREGDVGVAIADRRGAEIGGRRELVRRPGTPAAARSPAAARARWRRPRRGSGRCRRGRRVVLIAAGAYRQEPAVQHSERCTGRPQPGGGRSLSGRRRVARPVASDRASGGERRSAGRPHGRSASPPAGRARRRARSTLAPVRARSRHQPRQPVTQVACRPADSSKAQSASTSSINTVTR